MSRDYTAREWMNLARNRNPEMRPIFDHPAYPTIDRALSLAAAVDEAGEEVVQSLHIMSIVHMMDPRNRSVIIKAAALLVSQREEIKRKDAEIAGLRQHAEAMFVQCMNADRLSANEVAFAYRAAHQKE